MHYIHRLVAKYFVVNDSKDKKLEINHEDGDKSNNVATNLKWVTRSENLKHAIDTGLRVSKKGEECCNAKLTKFDVIEIRKACERGVLHKNIAVLYKISPGYVSHIQKRNKWKYI